MNKANKVNQTPIIPILTKKSKKPKVLHKAIEQQKSASRDTNMSPNGLLTPAEFTKKIEANQKPDNTNVKPLIIGTKKEVWEGKALKTSGGLKKSDLMKNTRGKIISIKKHAAGLKVKQNILGSKK